MMRFEMVAALFDVGSWWVLAWIAFLALMMALWNERTRPRRLAKRARRTARWVFRHKKLESGPYTVTLISFDERRRDELRPALAWLAQSPSVELSGDPQTVLQRVADLHPETLASGTTEGIANVIKQAIEARGAHVRITSVLEDTPSVLGTVRPVGKVRESDPADSELIELLVQRDGQRAVVRRMSGNPSPEIDAKVGAIRRAFAPVIGARLSSYSTAELRLSDGTWDAWPDLPIRLEWGLGRVVAVSWSKFDDLWIATDDALPFSASDDPNVRWVHNAVKSANRVVGAVLRSVALGRGEMSVAGQDIEIWTRLLLETDRGWLEIFNALDENGYEHHAARPSGVLVPCA